MTKVACKLCAQLNGVGLGITSCELPLLSLTYAYYNLSLLFGLLAPFPSLFPFLPLWVFPVQTLSCLFCIFLSSSFFTSQSYYHDVSLHYSLSIYVTVSIVLYCPFSPLYPLLLFVLLVSVLSCVPELSSFSLLTFLPSLSPVACEVETVSLASSSR